MRLKKFSQEVLRSGQRHRERRGRKCAQEALSEGTEIGRWLGASQLVEQWNPARIWLPASGVTSKSTLNSQYSITSYVCVCMCVHIKKDKDLLRKDTIIDSQLAYLKQKLNYSQLCYDDFPQMTTRTYLLVAVLILKLLLPFTSLLFEESYVLCFLFSYVKCHYFLKWLSCT